MLFKTDSSVSAFVLFYLLRRPRGVISTPVIRTFGRGGRYYGRGYKNQGAIQVITRHNAGAGSLPSVLFFRLVFSFQAGVLLGRVYGTPNLIVACGAHQLQSPSTEST